MAVHVLASTRGDMDTDKLLPYFVVPLAILTTKGSYCFILLFYTCEKFFAEFLKARFGFNFFFYVLFCHHEIFGISHGA